MPHTRDADSASSTSGQSKRPPLNHQESDSQSESSGVHNQHQHQQHRRHVRHHQRQHTVGHLHHARGPGSKTAPKQPKLSRRHTDTPDQIEQQQLLQRNAATSNSHRRAASDAKLSSRDSSSGNLIKSASQTKLTKNSSHTKLVKSPSHSKLKRNRSHTEIGKRTRSAELKRASSTTIVYQPQTSGGKSQVHFDLGNEEDEWVDASGSNSPYLSRKGSLNSSNHSVHPDDRSRPVTPSDIAAYKQAERDHQEPEQQNSTSPERETAHHKEYLTSRILKRTPSHGAPPQMSADLAQISPRRFAPASAEAHGSGTLAGSNTDELTSRFVEAVGSGLTSDGSFYRPRRGDFPRFNDAPHKARSVTSLKGDREDRREPPTSAPKEEVDDSALAPKTARRTAPPAAQTSRTQQKLNLQRASSVIEPGQAVGGVGGVVGHTPLIGVGGPGYDGGNSRDPRVGKLLERTGMEYLVVRRYQNPISRSLERLNHLPGVEKSLRIPRPYSASTNGKRTGDLVMRQHTRNVSMPDARRPITPKRAASVRTNGAGSSYDGNDDDGRLTDRLSGSSLVGGEEEDGTTALLRNLWEKSTELSASTD
ncbi:hypothetical protein FLONG3_4434 [Fusarium longipes]|uniref:Uncharacterized protein n=1 Tax=Fusarium longipes TaxID=694270 RepID=A0A395SZX0_9HYPO|nr:hypothetical protein FLONG3_4434 [Fusarium longipes]